MTEPIATVQEAAFWLFNVAGPLAVYAPQWLLMRRKRTVGSFSKLMCYCLIVAHFLRLVFRLGAEFHPSLVAQSALVIVIQSFLLHTCLQLERATRKPGTTRAWAPLGQQLAFLLMPVSTWGLLYCLFPRPGLAELTGALSAIFEALLPVPQIVNNFKRKSVESVSKAMVVMWALGDAGKFGFFLWTGQPVQFVLCAGALVCLDLAVLAQFWLYAEDAEAVDSLQKEQGSPTRSFIRVQENL